MSTIPSLGSTPPKTRRIALRVTVKRSRHGYGWLWSIPRSEGLEPYDPTLWGYEPTMQDAIHVGIHRFAEVHGPVSE